LKDAMPTTYQKGRYRAEIIDQGFGSSPAKGTPLFFLQLRIAGRYDDRGELQACPRYERTYQQYLANDVGVRILRTDLAALDVRVSSLSQLDPEKPDAVRLTGRTIDVECDLEVYEGRERERWRIARSRKRLDRDAVQQLDDRFGHVFGSPAGAGDAPAPSADRASETNPS
jgi:hypothetical protein